MADFGHSVTVKHLCFSVRPANLIPVIDRKQIQIFVIIGEIIFYRRNMSMTCPRKMHHIQR